MPLSDGAFYSLYNAEYTNLSALHASLPKATKGMILSFAIAKGKWKTYQYTSESIEREDWINIDNWQDFGSLAAGSETYIIIDRLCGPRQTTGSGGNPLPYDLASAVQALADYEKASQITYRKRGLVHRFRRRQSARCRIWHFCRHSFGSTHGCRWRRHPRCHRRASTCHLSSKQLLCRLLPGRRTCLLPACHKSHGEGLGRPGKRRNRAVFAISVATLQLAHVRAYRFGAALCTTS